MPHVETPTVETFISDQEFVLLETLPLGDDFGLPNRSIHLLPVAP
jgi:hypothetical protein